LMIDQRKWVERKQRFWKRLWEDLEIGYLDEDLLPLLVEFNLRPDTYTLSSCSGRIVVVDSYKPWAREETNVVFKKHQPISIVELRDILGKPVVRRLWLIVSGPIIHVSTNSLGSAAEILRISREAGFKHSGILSINRFKGVVLELLTGVKMIHLLVEPGKYSIYEKDLGVLVDIANEILLDGKKMLHKLYTILHENRPDKLDDYIVNDLVQRGLMEYTR